MVPPCATGLEYADGLVVELRGAQADVAGTPIFAWHFIFHSCAPAICQAASLPTRERFGLVVRLRCKENHYQLKRHTEAETGKCDPQLPSTTDSARTLPPEC